MVLDGKMVRTRAAAAIWTNVLRKYTDPRDEDAFDKAFTMDGQRGYKKFMREITNVAFASLKNEEDLSDQEKAFVKQDWVKHKGWLYNVAINLDNNLWQVLLATLDEDEAANILGNAGWYRKYQKLLQGWSKKLDTANTESNVKFGNKVVQIGDLSIAGTSKGTPPSRVVQDVRSFIS